MKKGLTMLKGHTEELKLGLRIALFVFFVSFGMVTLLATIQKVMAADLRPEATIDGEYIRLGDIFDDVENAEYVLGPAPQPGKDMILNARTLYKIASSLNINWKPQSSTDQIILRREAIVLSQSDISKSIEEKIVENGVDETFSVIMTSGQKDMVLPAGTDETMEITAFRFDPQTDNFNAVVVAPSAENPIKRVNVSGRIERLVTIPVLKNALKNGDIIGGQDIDYIEVAKNKISKGAILQEQDLINMTPRRTIAGGKPVMINDLESPKMVDRGDSVTLIFENGPMVLTVKGKSLQGGAMGDTVRVSNSDSNKNLQGIVTAHREVTIR